MSRNSTLILLGILVVLTPFSGLPIAFRTLLTVIFGACVAGIGFSLRTHEVQNAAATQITPLVEPETVEPVAPQTISPM